MNNIYLTVLAFSGGIFLAIQGGFNAQLGTLLKSPILASLSAFFFSALFAAITVIIGLRQLPSPEQIKTIPVHLWFSGALFSFIGICLYYYTIPRLGISTMISLGLGGQLVFSIVAGHFGWFNMPLEPVSLKRIVGLVAMIAGIYLVNNQK